MTYVDHEPAWHQLDVDEPFQADDGLALPKRNVGAATQQCLVAPAATSGGTMNTLVIRPFGLLIANLDRGVPPAYEAGGVPRSPEFLAVSNVLQMPATPAMPSIAVEVQCNGFDPAATPIHFRLQTLHVLGRFVNQGHYRYRKQVERYEAEWQGTASASRFCLFDKTDESVRFTFGGLDDPPSGGHAILTVAARPPGASTWLVDYVHLRIGGTNPAASTVVSYIDDLERNVNIKLMLKAIFAHESGMEHFLERPQTGARMVFKPQHHQKNSGQPDCTVRFRWPDDPANHPKATYDFGVGVSQITRTRTRALTGMEVWDWRENVHAGANILFDKLRAQYERGMTWLEWAAAGMHRYNGAGQQAAQYAETVRASEFGSQISTDVIPSSFDRAAAIAHFEPATRPWPPPTWEPHA